MFHVLPVCLSYSHLALTCFSTPWAIINILPLLPLALASSLSRCPLLQPKVSATVSQNLILGSIMYVSVYMVVEGWRIKCDKITSKCLYYGYPGCYDQVTMHGGKDSTPRCLPPHVKTLPGPSSMGYSQGWVLLRGKGMVSTLAFTGPLLPTHLMEMVTAIEHPGAPPLSPPSLACRILQSQINPCPVTLPLPALLPCPSVLWPTVLQIVSSLLSPSTATEKFKALRQLIWELPEIDPLHNNYTEKKPLSPSPHLIRL